jgi:hypothetical protein
MLLNPIHLVVIKICLKQAKFKHVLYELYATLLKEQGKGIINKTTESKDKAKSR